MGMLEGSIPSLEEVLKNRENRSLFQKKLSDKFPEQTLISLKCNIPGPVKNNETIRQLFEIGKTEIEGSLSTKDYEVIYFKEINLPTGPECFYVVNGLPIDIKQLMIEIEEQKELGRLFDNDVLYNKNGLIESISRKELKYPLRQCLICKQDAKSCGRNRTHQLEELYEKIENIIRSDGRIRL